MPQKYLWELNPLKTFKTKIHVKKNHLCIRRIASHSFFLNRLCCCSVSFSYNLFISFLQLQFKQGFIYRGKTRAAG
jgi:hypothetical protein